MVSPEQHNMKSMKSKPITPIIQLPQVQQHNWIYLAEGTKSKEYFIATNLIITIMRTKNQKVIRMHRSDSIFG